ncbi:hypothetical protein [Hyalangium gracile]|uniref:hypothetical protein n=1 Tax=Hyalangium gracile TaxID=394092 RepID=UPI001CCD5457|nr:hypothetical protein [Hyalangium gracile]
MHRRLSLLLATLLITAMLGCPLDIQVRCEHPSCEPCEGEACLQPRPCEQDSHCQAGWRCNEDLQCEQGPRLGEPCEDLECQTFAVCHLLRQRCEYSCGRDADCPPGYRCGSDSLCIVK